MTAEATPCPWCGMKVPDHCETPPDDICWRAIELDHIDDTQEGVE